MKKIIGIGIGLIIVVLLFSGCFDTKGREICKDSLDNLCLPDGYELLDYDSDFVSGDYDSYFVWYLISYNDKEEWIGERPHQALRYYFEDGRLEYWGDNSTVSSWICNP